MENLINDGDYLSDIEFPFVYYSFSEYDKTLRTLQRLCSEKNNLTLITSHGTVTDEPMEIQKRLKDSEEYLILLKNEPSDVDFTSFMEDKDYRFLTILKKRHQDNLQVWKEQS